MATTPAPSRPVRRTVCVPHGRRLLGHGGRYDHHRHQRWWAEVGARPLTASSVPLIRSYMNGSNRAGGLGLGWWDRRRPLSVGDCRGASAIIPVARCAPATAPIGCDLRCAVTDAHGAPRESPELLDIVPHLRPTDVRWPPRDRSAPTIDSEILKESRFLK
jgi:hypothetical protein